MPLRRRRGVKKLVVEQIQMAPHPAFGHTLPPMSPNKTVGGEGVNSFISFPSPLSRERGQG